MKIASFLFVVYFIKKINKTGIAQPPAAATSTTTTTATAATLLSY
jgi:hypothetical protein